MYWLALKTLFHEKGRLIITLIGIVFSTVLSLTQVAMYLGMMGNATSIIRHVDADIWIAAKNIQNFDFANPFPEERINRVKAIPEVIWSDKLILTWGFLKLANGGQEQVQIIGFNPNTGIDVPWNILAGNPEDLKSGRYIIIDKTAEQRVGHLELNTIWELNEKRFKLVGLSEGIKSFTTSPIVFMSYNQAQNFMTMTGWKSNHASFIVARLKDKDVSRDVAETLRVSLKDNDVFTKNDFIYKTVMYWTVQTGIGMGFFLTAILGLIVGGAIVGQTVYANTMEHLREFGTLKAMGARNSDIYKVIFAQTGINAVAGYVIGSGLILFAKDGIEKAGVSLYLSFGLFLALFFVILLTCILSAYFSVRKVRNLDPVMVFRM